jgi:translation initiation factor IF-1
MARDDLVPLEGKVTEVLAGGNFRITLASGASVLAQLAGRLRRNRIRVTLGDRVTVSVSPYDPSRGLITFRHA